MTAREATRLLLAGTAAVLALAAAFDFFFWTGRYGRENPDAIDWRRQQDAWRAIRSAVPPGEPIAWLGENPEGDSEFHLARYLAAPGLLVPAAQLGGAQWFVGRIPVEKAERGGLVAVRTLESGLTLFRWRR